MIRHSGGENFTLKDFLESGRGLGFRDRARLFSGYLKTEGRNRRSRYGRRIATASGREVFVLDPDTGRPKRMLMFGSNNYLGLANHPHVLRRVREAADHYGAGLGGPPLCNGTTLMHRELEERLSALKRAEETILFSSGYAANVGLLSALLAGGGIVIHDEFCHASFSDGLRMSGAPSVRFAHNDDAELASLLDSPDARTHRDVFVGVEGVYSVEGDLAPLDRIVPLCRKRGAILLLDDAHGTGVLGRTGAGTAEQFGLEGEVDITLGTFSKTFGVTGGFVSSSGDVVEYLRFFARSHVFSASLPPIVVAAVLGGLEVLEREPKRRARLHANVASLAQGLRERGFDVHPGAAIVSLRVPESMDVAEASRQFQEAGIFLNTFEYPAVPRHEQRFRISVISEHTDEDLRRLLDCVEAVWKTPAGRERTNHDPLPSAR